MPVLIISLFPSSFSNHASPFLSCEITVRAERRRTGRKKAQALQSRRYVPVRRRRFCKTSERRTPPPPPGAPCPSPSAVTLQRPSECVSSFVSSRENNCFSRRATDKRRQLVWAKPEPYYPLPSPLCEIMLKGDRLSPSFSPSL